MALIGKTLVWSLVPPKSIQHGPPIIQLTTCCQVRTKTGIVRLSGAATPSPSMASGPRADQDHHCCQSRRKPVQRKKNLGNLPQKSVAIKERGLHSQLQHAIRGKGSEIEFHQKNGVVLVCYIIEPGWQQQMGCLAQRL